MTPPVTRRPLAPGKRLSGYYPGATLRRDREMKRFEGRRKARERYPYEPRLIGGKLVMPAELQRIHAIVQDAVEVEVISDEVRAVVETLWPELAYKLPPEQRDPGHRGNLAMNRWARARGGR